MGVRLQDAVMGALAQALPEIVPAAGSGTIVPVVFAEPSPTGPGVEVNVLEPLSGGTGGGSQADGLHARDVVDLANLRNSPLETVESKSSTRVFVYGLRPDSAGAGKFRGGCGVVFEFEVLAPTASSSPVAWSGFASSRGGCLAGPAARSAASKSSAPAATISSRCTRPMRCAHRLAT
jgi:N-methylhydantoinase B/oxoprolinase/acetone carboxylase alpha subunit